LPMAQTVAPVAIRLIHDFNCNTLLHFLS